MWRLRTLRGCHRVIAPSRYVRGELVRNGFSPERIRVLPYFTSRTPVWGECGSAPRILWVGRTDGGKGLDRFFHVLGTLKDRDWHAVVVGDGTNTPEVRAMAQASGIGDRTRLLGRLEGEELDKQYAASRVVALTSGWAETFGQVGIEAMAFGKPVVAFDVGGVPEWLEDSVTGFLVHRDDVAGMAERLARLLADERLCQRMGVAGHAAVESRFRVQHHLPKLLEVFREAIAESGRVLGEHSLADRPVVGARE